MPPDNKSRSEKDRSARRNRDPSVAKVEHQDPRRRRRDDAHHHAVSQQRAPIPKFDDKVGSERRSRRLSEVEGEEYDHSAPIKRHRHDDSWRYSQQMAPRIETHNKLLQDAKHILSQIDPQSPEVNQQVTKALERLYEKIRFCQEPHNRTPGNVIQFLLQQLAKEAERERHSGDPELLEQLCFLVQHCQADITEPNHIALIFNALGKLADPSWLRKTKDQGRRLPYLESGTIINWLKRLDVIVAKEKAAQSNKPKCVVSAQHVGLVFRGLSSLVKTNHLQQNAAGRDAKAGDLPKSEISALLVRLLAYQATQHHDDPRQLSNTLTGCGKLSQAQCFVPAAITNQHLQNLLDQLIACGDSQGISLGLRGVALAIEAGAVDNPSIAISSINALLKRMLQFDREALHDPKQAAYITQHLSMICYALDVFLKTNVLTMAVHQPQVGMAEISDSKAIAAAGESLPSTITKFDGATLLQLIALLLQSSCDSRTTANAFSCLGVCCRAGYFDEVPAALLNNLLRQMLADSHSFVSSNYERSKTVYGLSLIVQAGCVAVSQLDSHCVAQLFTDFVTDIIKPHSHASVNDDNHFQQSKSIGLMLYGMGSLIDRGMLSIAVSAGVINPLLRALEGTIDAIALDQCCFGLGLMCRHGAIICESEADRFDSALLIRLIDAVPFLNSERSDRVLMGLWELAQVDKLPKACVTAELVKRLMQAALLESSSNYNLLSFLHHSASLITTKVVANPERLLPVLHGLLQQLQPNSSDGMLALATLAKLMQARPFPEMAQLDIALIENLLVDTGLAELEDAASARHNRALALFYAGLVLSYLRPCDDLSGAVFDPNRIGKVVERLLKDDLDPADISDALHGLSNMVYSGYLHCNATLKSMVERLFKRATAQPLETLETINLIALLHSMTIGGLGSLDKLAQQRFLPWFKQIAKRPLYRKVCDGEELSAEEYTQAAHVDSAHALLYTPRVESTKRSFFARPPVDFLDQRSKTSKIYFDKLRAELETYGRLHDLAEGQNGARSFNIRFPSGVSLSVCEEYYCYGYNIDLVILVDAGAVGGQYGIGVEVNGSQHYSGLTEGLAPVYVRRQNLLEQLGWEIHNCPVERINLHVLQMVNYVQRVVDQVADGAVPEGLRAIPDRKEHKNGLVRFWRPAAAQAQPPAPQRDPMPVAQPAARLSG